VADRTPAATTAATSRVPAGAPQVGPAVARPLVVWAPVSLVPEVSDGGDVVATALGGRLEVWGNAHPDLAIEVKVMPARGGSGVHGLLRAAAQVVPSRLPDAAILPLDVVSDVVAAGLAQAWPADESTAWGEDAFGFAAAQVGWPTATWAMPLAVDVAHGIGRRSPPPSGWGAVRPDDAFVLPMGGPDLPDLAAVLSAYGAAGGSLDRPGRPEPTAAASTLSWLAEGVERRALLRPNNGTSPRAAWNTFVTGEQGAAAVSGGVFAPLQAKFPGLSWGPLPGPLGPAPPVAWGWAFVVITRDAARAAEARALAAWLAEPSAGGWIVAAGLLPVRKGRWVAVVAAALDPPPAAAYLEFVYRQLETARGVSGFDTWGRAWAAAIEGTLTGAPLERTLAEWGRG